MSEQLPRAGLTARTFRLLRTFDMRHRRLLLSDIARRAELPLSTTHRLVNDMVAEGALVRRSDGSYSIGKLMWELGLLAPVETGLRQIASPFLHDLFGATGETVHLAVRDGTEVLYLDRLASHLSVQIVSDVGSRLPLHATAVGKVLLAHAPPEVVELVMTGPLAKCTPFTATDPSRLGDQLSSVIEHGYVATREEMSLGACSVAVPVEGVSSRVVAALGIVVPGLDRERQLAAALDVASRGITRVMRQRASRG